MTTKCKYLFRIALAIYASTTYQCKPDEPVTSKSCRFLSKRLISNFKNSTGQSNDYITYDSLYNVIKKTSRYDGTSGTDTKIYNTVVATQRFNYNKDGYLINTVSNQYNLINSDTTFTYQSKADFTYRNSMLSKTDFSSRIFENGNISLTYAEHICEYNIQNKLTLYSSKETTDGITVNKNYVLNNGILERVYKLDRGQRELLPYRFNAQGLLIEKSNERICTYDIKGNLLKNVLMVQGKPTITDIAEYDNSPFPYTMLVKYKGWPDFSGIDSIDGDVSPNNKIKLIRSIYNPTSGEVRYSTETKYIPKYNSNNFISELIFTDSDNPKYGIIISFSYDNCN